jgi:hypothetical protein
MSDLFVRAEALGVSVTRHRGPSRSVDLDHDLEKLLEAVHEQEGKLMLLRHAIERRIADIYINESP